VKKRIGRLAEEIKREISFMLRDDIRDPRLPQMISIVSVDLTNDLRYAKVYVSVLGSAEECKKAMLALKSASGFIRRGVGQKIKMFYVPELQFELDTSIAQGAYISKLIDETMHGKEQ